MLKQHRGGERGVIAAGGLGHGGRAREAQRAAEGNLEGRGLGRRRVHERAKSKSGKFQEDSRKARPSDRMRQEDDKGGPQDTGKAQEPEGPAEKAGSKKDKYQKAQAKAERAGPFKGIKNGQMFDENFLMAIATVGAFGLAVYEKSGDYNEAIAVMLFYQIGELFQSYAVGKSRRNISELMDIRPDYANIEKEGKLEQVDPEIGRAHV